MKYENYTMDECDGDGYCVNTAHLHLGKSAFCNVFARPVGYLEYDQAWLPRRVVVSHYALASEK